MQKIQNQYSRLLLEEGNRLEKEKKIDCALKKYTEALKNTPDFVPAHRHIARLYKSRKNFHLARIHYQKIVEINPKHLAALIGLGSVEIELGKFAEAIVAYQKAIAIKPEQPPGVYRKLGDAFKERGYLDEARWAYRTAQQKHPIPSPEIEEKVEESSEPTPPRQDATVIEKTADTAEIQPAKKSSKIEPNPHKILAQKLVGQGKISEAIVEYRKALALNPQDPALLTNFAKLLERSQKWSEAIELYQKAISIQPQNADVYFYLGRTLAAWGNIESGSSKAQKLEEAKSAYRQGFALNPNNPWLLTRFAKLLEQQEEWSEAIELYQKAITIQPQNSNSYLALGKILTSQGKIELALSNYEQGIESNPSSDAWIYNRLRDLLKESDRLAEAIDRYRDDIEQNSNHPGLSIRLGDALAAHGKLDTAVTYYQKALELGFDRSWLFTRLQTVLFELGRFDDAEAECQKLVDKYPDDPQGWEGLARIAVRCQKFELAFDRWQQVTVKFPDRRPAYVGLAHSLAELGKLEEAKAVFQKLADKYPNESDGLEGLARIAVRCQEWETALEYWEVCVAKWSGKVEFQANLGKALLQVGRFKDAEAIFQKLELDYRDRYVGLEGLAKVARVSGNPELSLHYSQLLKERFPDRQSGYWETEQALIELGRFDEATQAYLSRPENQKQAVKRKLPADFPPDLVLPEIVGVNNDYTFIEEKVREFAASDRSYTLPVSILIPVYNRKEILAKTLAVIVHQTYPKELIEVVAIDDGSSDGVEDVIRKYENHLELIYVRQADRGYRLSAARNLGARSARHPYLILLDCDVIPHPNLVEAYMKFFHVSDRAILIGYRKYICSDSITDNEVLQNIESVLSLPEIKTNNEVSVGKTHTGETYDWRLSLYARTNYLKKSHWSFSGFVGANVAYPRQVIDTVGGYDEDFQEWGSEDNEFGYRCYNAGYYFIPIMDAIGFHQEPPGGNNETDREAGLKITRKQLEQKCPVPNYRPYQKGAIYEVPKVSIYIPAYNSEKYIKAAVDSALAQTYTDLEVCICDDGSTDDTLKILEENYRDRPRVRWVSQQNSGIGKASNTAVRMCRGMYIGQLDADDILKPNAVELAVNYLDRHDVGCVYSSYDVIDAAGNFVRQHHHHLEFSREALLTGMIVSHFRMFRKRDWMRTTGFAEGLVNAVDYDMFLKLSEVCYFAQLDSSNYCYRWHGENTSVQNRTCQESNHFLVINSSLKRFKLDSEWEAVAADITKPRSVKLCRKAREIESSQAYIDRGEKLQADGKIDEAIEQYQRALSLDGQQTAQFYLNLVNCLQQQNRDDDAIEIYQQGVEEHPKNLSLRENFARTLMQKDRFQEAIQHYNQALPITSKKAAIYQGLGDAYRRLNLLEAIAYAEESISK